ncbi:type II toxin-antitoxin system VapC family toxin [Fodinicola feengrottensis]|uniref:Ribonuclease VapC n=1 Tax=Fodinicola feengrottensis TaxID=435914 RepID=A0ABN2FZ11_9ACTN
MIYVDSCALVKLVITEKETAALQAYLADRQDEVVTSDLAVTEVIRVVRRSCYDTQRNLRVDPEVLDERLAAAADLLDHIDRVTVDTDTFISAGMYADDPYVGSLDAIHLVCAQEIGPALTSFVTYDRTLAQAARRSGFPVDQPG